MKKLLRELSKYDLDMAWIHWDPISRKSHIYSWDQDTLIYWDSAAIRNKLMLVVGTSLRGRMIMVSHCDLYDYIWSDMIFDLMFCMNSNYYWDKLIQIRVWWEQRWSRTLSQLFLLVWAPRVRNWDGGLLGLKELWTIGCYPYLLPIRLENVAPLSS